MKERHRVFDTFASALIAANENCAPNLWAEQAVAGLSDTYDAALNELREEFPLLASAGKDRALGGMRTPDSFDDRTRQLVMGAATLGDRTQFRTHAGHALDIGVRQDELKEIVYLTAVHAGLRRAIDAARALSELFAERWEASQPIN